MTPHPDAGTLLFYLLRAKRKRSLKRGHPEGAPNVIGADPSLRIYCQRVPLGRNYKGHVAPDGTYWGGGEGTMPLFCAFTKDLATCYYIRAPNRRAALRAFYNEPGTPPPPPKSRWLRPCYQRPEDKEPLA